MPEEKKVLIIGAGPIGCLLGEKLSSQNIPVTIFEENKNIGKPDHCAGLVNIKNINKIYNFSNKVILNKINGAIIRFGNESVELYRNKEEAIVLDRINFDKNIAENARKKGVEIRLERKVVNFKRENSKFNIIFNNSNKDQKSDYIINAAGVKGLLSKNFGCNYKGLKFALQYEMSNVRDISDNFVELYFNNDLTPGFFSWIIPINGDKVRVGLATTGSNIKSRLDFFINKISFNKDRFKKAQIIHLKPGVVITGGPIYRVYKDNQIAVGDAAGHVKPTTGGGLITGGLCAGVAANIINDMIVHNINSPNLSLRFNSEIKNILGKEFTYMSYVRRILDNINNKYLIKLFNFLKEKQIIKKIINFGDMDLQSKFIISLLKDKRIIKLLPVAMKGLIRSFID
jgi:digeranylgeranylglycerophospholipid reductase